jgi:hypothetical protein
LPVRKVPSMQMTGRQNLKAGMQAPNAKNDISRLIFDLYRGGTCRHTPRRLDGPYRCGRGLTCRRSARRFVASHYGPRRLTSAPVGAYGRHPNRHGPRR